MRWIHVAGMMCLLWSGRLSAAEEASPLPAAVEPTAEERSDGFASIFDGKTLDGWRGATDGYVCEEGLLVCQKRGGGRLFTVKEFGDFVFRFDYRLEPGGNNGISVRGHEIQVLDDDAPQYKNLKPCQYHGSIYCTVPAIRGHTKPAGEWNSEEIMCQGSHWKVSVNGAVIVDVDLATIPGQETLAKRTKGPLGFLGHGARVEFRNLRVKELTGAGESAKDKRRSVIGMPVRPFVAVAPDSADGPEPVRRTGSGLPDWRLDRRPDKMLTAEWLWHCGIGVPGRID